jgi:hypothetical protein
MWEVCSPATVSDDRNPVTFPTWTLDRMCMQPAATGSQPERSEVMMPDGRASPKCEADHWMGRHTLTVPQSFYTRATDSRHPSTDQIRHDGHISKENRRPESHVTHHSKKAKNIHTVTCRLPKITKCAAGPVSTPWEQNSTPRLRKLLIYVTNHKCDTGRSSKGERKQKNRGPARRGRRDE